MAIAFPRTDMFEIGFADQKRFDLVERQELSRTAGGRAIGKSFGSPLWFVDFTTEALRFADAVDFQAMLHSLDGVMNRFAAYDLRRPYPRAHPKGDFVDSGEIASIGEDNKSLALKNLPAGLVLSRGDYLAFDYGAGPSRALHQLMEGGAADGAGLTAEFEVRPHFRPGVAVDIAISLKKPSALFTLDAQPFDASIQGRVQSFNFRAVQVL